MSVQKIRSVIENEEWISIATEIRPGIVKSADNVVQPLYCTRQFFFPGDDVFHLTFTSFADPFGKTPLVEMQIYGHITFGKEHAIATGAYELDYIADISFVMMPLHDRFAALLNQFPLDEGMVRWQVGETQNVFMKSVPALALRSGEYFSEYDLIYVKDNLLFNGSRNIDGRPFDSPQNRPTNLQVPLIKRSGIIKL